MAIKATSVNVNLSEKRFPEKGDFQENVISGIKGFPGKGYLQEKLKD